MNWDEDAYVGMDFETSGELPEYALQPWRIRSKKTWATSLVWVHNGVVSGSLFPKRAMIRGFLEEARDQQRTIVCWNAVFDIAVCIGYGFYDLVMENKWLDGMLIWRHQFIEPEYDETGRNKKSYSLKKAVPEFLPLKAGYEDDINYHSIDPAELAKLHEYNIRDVEYTLTIARTLFEKLTPKQQRAMFIESHSLPLVAAANFQGMLIDVPYTHELGQSLLNTSNRLLAELAPHGVTEKIVRSPLQLAKLMFDKWKLPVIKMTASSARSTDKETLHELSFKDPRAKSIREYREALGNKTKFVDTPLEAARYNQDFKAHPQGIVFGTYSGRMTYSSKQGKNKDERQTGFALHQMKNEARFREIVVAPLGFTLVEFDAAGQEFRWMAEASKDQVMLSLCEPGEDPHSFMGARIGHVDYAWMRANKETDPRGKTLRKSGKVGNLSLQYRTTAKKFVSVARVQHNIPMTLYEGQQIRKVYLETYKGVPEYWEHQIRDVAAKGYAETFASRRVIVKGDWSGKNAWSMASTAINYRIQGTGADQKYLALMCIKNTLVDTGSYFAWDLHDGLYFYVPDAMVEKFVTETKDTLDNLPYQAAWGYSPSIPLPWDCKTGKSWGSLKEWKFT